MVDFLIFSAERERVREESEARDPAICRWVRRCTGDWWSLIDLFFVGLLWLLRDPHESRCHAAARKKKKVKFRLTLYRGAVALAGCSKWGDLQP